MIHSLVATALAVGHLASPSPKPEYDIVYVRNFDPQNTGIIARQVNNSGVVIGVGPFLTYGGVWRRGTTEYDPGLSSGTTQAANGSGISQGFTAYAGISNNGIIAGLTSPTPSNVQYGSSAFPGYTPRSVAFRVVNGQVDYLQPVPPLDPWIVPEDNQMGYMPDVTNQGSFMYVANRRIDNFGPNASAYTVLYTGQQSHVLPRANSQVLRTLPVDISDSNDLLTIEEAPNRRFAVLRERGGRIQELKPFDNARASQDGYKNLRLLPYSAFENAFSGIAVPQPEVLVGKYVVNALRVNKEVVGGAFDPDGFVKATVWKNSEPKALPKVDGFDSSQACRVTDDGTIVGLAWNRHGAAQAEPKWVVWHKGKTPVLLSDCIDRNAGISVTSVMDVSDNGIILALTNRNLKRGEYVLLVPKGVRLQ